jgi:hypothetical protein
LTAGSGAGCREGRPKRHDDREGHARGRDTAEDCRTHSMPDAAARGLVDKFERLPAPFFPDGAKTIWQ